MPLVLLIEDSPTQAEEIASQISRYGVDVMVANDGLQGLRLVDSNRPDLILLDVNLPKMDGYQVCHRLKRDPDTKSIPVVMLTVASGSDDTLKGLEAGADDYIPKDAFAVENLTGTLRSLGLIS
jgi:twitching motility two-component system response regulator PilH